MEEMARHPGRRLVGLDLVVGAWSGADPESLEFALGLLIADSAWPAAKVRTRREGLALRCKRCGREYEVEDIDLACPDCKTAESEAVRGTELRLESLEVE
jgi:hydrogenase nickel incorporation protein HypA/HybF